MTSRITLHLYTQAPRAVQFLIRLMLRFEGLNLQSSPFWRHIRGCEAEPMPSQQLPPDPPTEMAPEGEPESCRGNGEGGRGRRCTAKDKGRGAVGSRDHAFSRARRP